MKSRVAQKRSDFLVKNDHSPSLSNFLLLLLFLVIGMFFNSCWAVSISSCKNLGFYFKNHLLYLQLSQSTQGIYILRNSGSQTLLLDHRQRLNPGVSAGWGSQLLSNHWSALMLSRSNFALMCQHLNRDYTMKPVDCAQALQVCQLSSFIVKDPLLKNKSFWLSENKSNFKQLLTAINSRKIILKDYNGQEK